MSDHLLEPIGTPSEGKQPRLWLWALSLLVFGCVGIAGTYLLERFRVVETGFISALFGEVNYVDHVFTVTFGDATLVVDGQQLRRIERFDDGNVERIEIALPIPVNIALPLNDTVYVAAEAKVSDSIFVSIQHQPDATTSVERLELVYPHYLAETEAFSTYGLTIRTFAEDQAYGGQQLLHAVLDDNEVFAMRCDIPQTDSLPSICRRQIATFGDLLVVYRYHRRHLGDWENVENVVVTYIKSLMQADAQ